MSSTVAVVFISLLIAIVSAANPSDPCLPDNHQELDQPDRSVAVSITPGGVGGRSDENLPQDWYRFTSAAGGEIPMSPPQTGQCSSKKPIWLNGTQPPLDQQIHTIDLCYYLNSYDTCGIKLQIRAKACVNYIVYELVPTSSANTTQVITDGTYCAGSEKLCPAGQSSLTGFTPNCYVAPTVATKPVIDLNDLNDPFEFHCIVNIRPQAAYKVVWKLGSTIIHQEDLNLGHDISILKETQITLPNRRVVLGRNLTCSAHGRYLSEPAGRWGAPRKSDPFFIGIEVSDASGLPLQLQSHTLTLPESYDHQTINIRSTIPIRCDKSIRRLSGKDCKVEIAILNDNSMDTKPLRCKNGVVEQLKLATCSVTLTPDNWSASQPISIRATKDFKYDGDRSRIIEFKMTDGPGKSIWDGYVPHSIQVVTEDFIDSRAQCSSLNDPHMTTFDGHKWHNYYEGEFVLYRHTELPFEVRAFYKRCSARSSASCNCAVAARAGDDVIIVDRCNSMGDIKIWGSDKKVEYNLLRTRTISTDDIISPNFRIFSINGGREYMIYFPHGAVLRAQLTGGGYAQFMNLWLNPSPADYNRTEGMCGTFNKDKTEDLRWRNGSLYTGAGATHNQHPREFSKHWRVQTNESIYNGQVPGSATTYQNQYCSCVKPQSGISTEYLDCQLNSDALRCDQRGEDITSKNFEYSAGATKKAEPFTFDPDWNPPLPGWPTPSGWTKANATKFCEDFIKQSKAYKHCNITIDDDLDMCVEDIKLSDGIEFAMTALESFKDKCLTELYKDPNAVIPLDAFCFNECNHQGDCLNGVCMCHSGFAGEDCSLMKSSIPNVYFTPFCDVSSEECSTAEIHGQGFIDSADLTCTYQDAVISGGELLLTGSKQNTKASYENFAEVKCPVTGSRAKRALAKTPGQQAVSVANTAAAQTSNVVVYTKYDSRCQTCNMKTGECSVNDGKCLIGGDCYKEGDVNPASGKHGVCEPAHSQSAFKPAPGGTKPAPGGLPGWAIGVIASGATLAVVSFGIVVYMKLVRKRAKIVG